MYCVIWFYFRSRSEIGGRTLTMINIKNPCHKCNDREVGCHANCVFYLEFCEKKDKIKKAIKKAKEERIEMAEYDARIRKRINNYKKNHRISY